MYLLITVREKLIENRDLFLNWDLADVFLNENASPVYRTLDVSGLAQASLGPHAEGET